jgi:uncharacterized protein (DUF2141 family)
MVLWTIALTVAALSCSPRLVAAEEAKTGTLTVLATGFRNDAGHVLVQLANSAADYDEDNQAFRSAAVKIQGGKATIVFAEVPYGEYAVKLFHDENENQKLDMGLMGPKERYGFSNNVMGMLGPPAWEKAKFHIAQPELMIQIDTK